RTQASARFGPIRQVDAAANDFPRRQTARHAPRRRATIPDWPTRDASRSDRSDATAPPERRDRPTGAKRPRHRSDATKPLERRDGSEHLPQMPEVIATYETRVSGLWNFRHTISSADGPLGVLAVERDKKGLVVRASYRPEKGEVLQFRRDP